MYDGGLGCVFFLFYCKVVKWLLSLKLSKKIIYFKNFERFKD